MEITPDQAIYWQWGVVKLNATLVGNWVVMVLLAVGCRIPAQLQRPTERAPPWSIVNW